MQGMIQPTSQFRGHRQCKLHHRPPPLPLPLPGIPINSLHSVPYRVINGVDLDLQLFQGMIHDSVKYCDMHNEPLQFQYSNGKHGVHGNKIIRVNCGMIQLTVGKGFFTLEWAPEDGWRRQKPFDSHLIVAYYFLFSP